METIKGELANFAHLKELKPILSSEGPCISIYVPMSSLPNSQGANANVLKWKECIRSLQQKMEQHGPQGRELAETISDWDSVAGGIKPEGKSIAVFRSPDVFRVTWLDREVPSKAVIGPHFYIRPLLGELIKPKTFYLLALSQKDVRLLCCTTSRSEEVALSTRAVVTSFEQYMNSAKPDHTLNLGASAGPSAGSSKGVFTGTGTEKEDRDKYLSHFYKQIDRGVNDVLRGKTAPLVLAGVDYELSLYRDINSYPNLSAEAVHGAPNGLKAGEMHARAIEAMEREYHRKLDDALATYDHKVGAGATNRLRDIVTAVREGRVLTLFVSDTLGQPGSFNESTYAVKGRESGSAEDEDLVNDAAIQTILRAGQVFVVPNAKMPHGAPLAATYRF
jgi:hypothetical protein